MRRRVSRADVAELRKAWLADDPSDKIAVIIRTIVDPGVPIKPRTAEQEAMIAEARAAYRADGRIRQIILDNGDASRKISL